MTMPHTTRPTPDLVAHFAASVRARLEDLTPGQRDELAADLEANLTDLVDERGPDSLSDAETYACELRTAGGFPATAVPPTRPARGARVGEALDDANGRWHALAGYLPGHPWELVVALRPTWWVFRAWLALSAVDLIAGNGSVNLGLSLVPSLLGWGGPLLVVAVVGSLLVGTRRIWPGRGGPWARVSLLVLNLFAVGVVPFAVSSFTTAAEVVRWYGL